MHLHNLIRGSEKQHIMMTYSGTGSSTRQSYAQRGCASQLPVDAWRHVALSDGVPELNHTNSKLKIIFSLLPKQRNDTVKARNYYRQRILSKPPKSADIKYKTQAKGKAEAYDKNEINLQGIKFKTVVLNKME